uniref:BAG family molecular chaperone regulator 2 n=1 Tax=Ditylenchus dipsaci TaxID=166011 RepID=A0A915CUU7_9BILA
MFNNSHPFESLRRKFENHVGSTAKMFDKNFGTFTPSPIPAEYSPLPPTGQPHHFRQSSASPHYGGSMASGLNRSHQQQPQSGVHVIPVQHQQSAPSTKNIVEINNADPNSYTNGQLNPDKRRRFSNNMPQPTESQNNAPMKVPIVKVEDYSTKEGEQLQPGAVSPAISEQAIPLPPPPSCEPSSTTSSEETQVASKEVQNNNKKPMTNFVPLAGCTEQLINLLDETERRVEQLRETASQLEQEKESVLDILNNVKLSAEILKIEQSEEDELNLTAERILKRCRAVDVIVNTPRNEDQKRALDEVNMLIESIVTKMQDNLEGTKESIQRFLNACSPDEPNGHIDQRFQAKIVACTADDQKKIRRKLAQIISQIDRAERVCQPAN